MPAIPPSAFADRLQALPREDLVSFVADLWAASGWDTTVEGSTVVTRWGNTTLRLLVVTPTRFPLLRGGRDPPDRADADRVVTSGRATALGAGTEGPAVLSAGDLRERLLYAVPRDVAARLAREHLGVPPRGERWQPADPALVRLGRSVTEAATPGNAPVSRRTALGALALSAAGAGAWVLRAPRTGQDDAADTIDDDVESPVSSVPRTASFAFDARGDSVRVVHDGGEPIAAGQLLLRSRGLAVPPAVTWSEVSSLAPEATVSEGDAVTLEARQAFELTVLLDREGGTETLAEFSRGELDSGDDSEVEFEVPPSGSFSFGHDTDAGRLTITYEEGDPIRAGDLTVRGTGFSPAPPHHWSNRTDVGPDDAVTPGSTAAVLEAGSDVVARVVWDGEWGQDPLVLATYRGPDRPLTPTLDGVPTDRYGPANTGTTATGGGVPAGLREAWRFDRPRPFGSSIAVGDGTVVVGGADGTVFGLDAVDGAELWRTELGGATGGTPTVAGRTVYVRWFDRSETSVRALDLSDGSPQWSIALPHQQLGKLTFADGTVVLPAGGGNGIDGAVYAIDARNARSQWARSVDTFSFPAAVAVADGTVYATPSTGVVAYDLDSGTPTWEVSPETQGREYWWPMVDSDTLLYVRLGGDRDRIAALERADGSERWSVDLDGRVGTTPAVGDGHVYVPLREQGVRVLDSEDGSERSRLEVGEPVRAMTADRGMLYVAGADGTVHPVKRGSLENLDPVATGLRTVRSLVALDGWLFVSGEDLVAYRLQ